MSKTLPPAVKVLLFEVQSDWDTFPVHAFAMSDESPDEVYYKPPFSGKVLKGREPLIPRGAIDQDAYEEDGVATFESGARVLCEWFGECWGPQGERSSRLRRTLTTMTGRLTTTYVESDG